jgi:tRNA(Ile)-lysidine synthase
MRAPAALRRVADLAARSLAAVDVRPGDGIAVAVSGGADSLAALHALRTLAGPRGWRLAVVTVDHGLRPDSAADAAFVAAHAGALGLPAQVRTVDLAELAAHADQGPEGAARAVRYAALDAAAGELGCAWVATGHTLDDQAETLLLALLRGAGPDGLAGMAVVNGRVLRPLLGVTRAQTHACCAALGLAWREDETNADERLLRNAVRRRVLPLLEELRPGAAGTLARTAELARAEREWAEAVAAETLDALSAAPAGGGVRVKAAELAALPPGLGRRLVRAAARAAGQEPPGAAATDEALGLAGPAVRDGTRAAWPGGSAVRTGGLVVWPGQAG